MKNLSYLQKRQVYGIMFIIPWLIGFMLFYVSPILKVIANSMQTIKVTADGVQTSFVGADNFTNIFTLDPDFNKVLVQSVIETISSIPFIVIFSLLIAVILNTQFKGRGIARVIFILPLILGVDIVVSLGDVTNVNEAAGNLADSSTGLQALQLQTMLLNSSIPESISNLLITMVNGIFQIISISGVQTLIFLSALQSVNPALYEVAKIEGATTYETFWKVTIPSIIPMIYMVTVYTLIDSFYRSPVADEIYDAAFMNGDFGASAAMSVSYLVIAFTILAIIVFLFSGVVKKYASY